MSKPSSKAKSRAASTGVYTAVRGLNYGDPEQRVEPGEEVSDLPAESVDWLLEQGHIRPKEEVE